MRKFISNAMTSSKYALLSSSLALTLASSVIGANALHAQKVNTPTANKTVRSATNPDVYGESFLGGEVYDEFDINEWKRVARTAIEGRNPADYGEIVNYELISNGDFYITVLFGNKAAVDKHIFGYYYHSPGTYNDLTFVDIIETHQLDYFGGKAIVQYQLDGVDTWYDGNFDMFDSPDPDFTYHNLCYKLHVGDDAYGIIPAWDYYGDRFSKFRGLQYLIHVPEGMQLGFYMRLDEESSDEQYNRLKGFGIPSNRLPFPYKATNYSAQSLNILEERHAQRHRSWYRDMGTYCIMGLEDRFEKGDLDCNDVMYAITKGNNPNLVLPEVIEPYIDAVQVSEEMPWTLAFEDVYRDADYDFNDGVIQLYPDYENEKVCVKAMAAGITDRIVLHYDAPDGTDMVLGELHEALGSTTDKHVNTTSTMIGTAPTWMGCVPWPKDFTMTNDAKRFWVEIKRGDCADCTDILSLPDEPGLTPEALLVAGEWKWPKEGINIQSTYYKFKEWCKDPTNVEYWNWYASPVSSTYVSF